MSNTENTTTYILDPEKVGYGHHKVYVRERINNTNKPMSFRSEVKDAYLGHKQLTKPECADGLLGKTSDNYLIIKKVDFAYSYKIKISGGDLEETYQIETLETAQRYTLPNSESVEQSNGKSKRFTCIDLENVTDNETYQGKTWTSYLSDTQVYDVQIEVFPESKWEWTSEETTPYGALQGSDWSDTIQYTPRKKLTAPEIDYAEVGVIYFYVDEITDTTTGETHINKLYQLYIDDVSQANYFINDDKEYDEEKKKWRVSITPTSRLTENKLCIINLRAIPDGNKIVKKYTKSDLSDPYIYSQFDNYELFLYTIDETKTEQKEYKPYEEYIIGRDVNTAWLLWKKS